MTLRLVLLAGSRDDLEEQERERQLIDELRAAGHEVNVLAASGTGQLGDRLVATRALPLALAHELSNPLSFVAGNIEYALGKLADLRATNGVGAVIDEVIQALSDSAEGADRMTRLVRDLRDLGLTMRDEAHGED